jgi:hypothetical protein
MVSSLPRITVARFFRKAAMAACPCPDEDGPEEDGPEEDGRAPFTGSDKGRTFDNVMNVIVV